MTELQPTEIELTSRRRRHPLSKRRIAVYLITILVVTALALFTAFFAWRASSSPAFIQSQTLPVQP